MMKIGKLMQRFSHRGFTKKHSAQNDDVEEVNIGGGDKVELVGGSSSCDRFNVRLTIPWKDILTFHLQI